MSHFGKSQSCWGGIRTDCRDCKKLSNYGWRTRNYHRWLALKRKSFWNNRETIREKDHRRHTSLEARKKKTFRWKTDINYRLRQLIRNRLSRALHCGRVIKKEETLHLLGCTIPVFKTWLESRFSSEMSWDNYGIFWEIDHKTPCCKFDLSDLEQRKKCFHFTNCQPLKVSDNRHKGGR